MTAPATAIIGYDLDFAADICRKLFPHNPGAKDWFTDPAVAEKTTAFRNGTLQGAYFIIAARALGLDCGPMSGFDNAGVDREFFAGTAIKSNFLCGIGYGDPPACSRAARGSFDEACKIV
jgi:3-hydroxypropanoate dehydrogenase